MKNKQTCFRLFFFSHAQAKNSLSSQLRQSQADCDQLRDSLEEEMEARAEVQRQMTKVNGELNQLRAKFDGEAVQRAEELEEAKYVDCLVWSRVMLQNKTPRIKTIETRLVIKS